MSTTEEQVKKKLEEERRNKESFEQEAEQQRQEEKRRAALLEASQSDESVQIEEDDKQIFVAPSPSTNKSDWAKMVEDYKKKYPDKEVKDNTLIFPTRDDALKFFEQQATANPPRKFLGTELNGASGQPTGFHVFSCGDGVLYQGTLNEIQDKLKEAQKAKPDDPNIKEGLDTIARALNPAQDFRAAMKETRASAEQQTSGTEEELEERRKSSPNPLSTTPRSTPL